MPAVKDSALAAEPGRRVRPRRGSRSRGRRARRPRPSAGELLRRAELRPHRPAADAGGGARVRRRHRGPTPTSARSIGCWPRPTTASAWPSSGSTSCATPTASATTATTRGRSGATATGSSPPSTATCRSTASPPSSSPATCCPSATLEQKIASGYNRLLQTTEEGGAQPKEYRANYLADRVRNASDGVAGRDHGLRAVPRPQVRPVPRRATSTASRAFFADVKEKPVGRRQPDYSARRRASRPALEALEPEVDARRTDAATRPRRSATPRSGRGRRRSRAPARVRLHDASSRSRRRRRTARASLIQGNDFSIIASTAAGPKPPTRHLHRPVQDGARRASPRCASRR